MFVDKTNFCTIQKPKFSSKANSKSSSSVLHLSDYLRSVKLIKSPFKLENSLQINCLFLVFMFTCPSFPQSNGFNLKPNAVDRLHVDANSPTKFNVVLTNFINNWKLKHPTFNLTDEQLRNDLRTKRETNLEDELELVLKSKDPNGASIFERNAKSVDSSTNKFNSLEDKSADDEATCISCKPHEALKKYRLEQIKAEILRKLNLQKPPTVNLSSIPRQLILDHFLKNDPNYQNDHDPDDYASDEDEMRVKQVITLKEKGNSVI